MYVLAVITELSKPPVPTAVPTAVPRILMVCADNYGELMEDKSEHVAYIPFIVMVIVVGSMFLLSLLLGVTYDVFIEHTTEQVFCRSYCIAIKVDCSCTRVV